ncbi:hypothetical protein ABMX64_18610 [Vibrio vulnificus]|nr:hypothetical protein [Vibrio vulnificus]MCU8465622.1 hypothetical protein [Vibrio vulnificus]OJI30046.1 hypothetical protein VV99743_03519 [Vibrio vulnificus]OQK45258.1 hypothetical protein XM75_c20848 [Vibrio vulnificus]
MEEGFLNDRNTPDIDLIRTNGHGYEDRKWLKVQLKYASYIRWHITAAH